MKKYLTILFAIAQLISIAQEIPNAKKVMRYYYKVDSISDLKDAKDYKGCIRVFKELKNFQGFYIDKISYLCAIESMVNEKYNKTIVLGEIENLFKTGLDTNELLLQAYPSFLGFLKDNKGYIDKKITNWYSSYYAKIKISILLDLEEMIGADSYLRRLELKRRKVKTVPDSLLWPVVQTIDSINSEKLKDITKKYGFPSPKNVGATYRMAYVILLHATIDGKNDTTEWSFYEPLILGLINSGQINPFDYSYWVDRYFVWKLNKPQKYGTLIYIDDPNTKNKGTFKGGIEDISNVDKRRTLIGLPPLAYTARVRNVTLPENYNEKLIKN
jgi:hypothetical protein